MAIREIKGVIGTVKELDIRFFGKSIHGKKDGAYELRIDKDSLMNLIKEPRNFRILHTEAEGLELNDQFKIFIRENGNEGLLIMSIERLWDLGEEMYSKPSKISGEISINDLNKLKNLFKIGGKVTIMIKDTKGITEQNRTRELKGKDIVMIID